MLDDMNYNIYLFMKVIVTLFKNNLIHPMLLVQNKRINVLFYIQLVPFIIPGQFQFQSTFNKGSST